MSKICHFWDMCKKTIKSTYLCIRFPFLNSSRRLVTTYSWYDVIPTGWRKRFGMDLCRELKQAILKSGGKEYLKSFCILDIKEKYGQLILDTGGQTPEVDRVIKKYEYLSQYVCVVCGDDAVKRTTGWICPYCDKCVPNEMWIWIDPIYEWSNPEKAKYNEEILKEMP